MYCPKGFSTPAEEEYGGNYFLFLFLFKKKFPVGKKELARQEVARGRPKQEALQSFSAGNFKVEKGDHGTWEIRIGGPAAGGG